MACGEDASEAGRHEIVLERAQRIAPAVTQTSISAVGTADEGWAANTEEGAAVVAANPKADSFRNSRRVGALDISSVFLTIAIPFCFRNPRTIKLRADLDHHACAFCNKPFIPTQLCREDSSGVPAPRQ